MPEETPEPRDRRIASVDRRLREARKTQEESARADAERLERARRAREAGDAWRIVIDIVVATALGAGIGYGLDRWVGSAPWGLILGLVAGFAVAMWLAFRWASKFGRGRAPPAEGS